jgi:AcrR family transcriptional regulator
MPPSTDKPRPPLRREAVVQAALELLDQRGLEALSMRSVAAQLGVEAMSLYRHVASKEDLVLAVADRVLAEIELPPQGTPWREAMRQRARSAREVFLRHPSAALLVESCATLSPARLAYAESTVGLLMDDGFDPTLAYRAFLLLDSYIYGFAMQELSWPRGSAEANPPASPDLASGRYPRFTSALGAAMGRVEAVGLQAAYAEEFNFGLERLLEGLEGERGRSLRAVEGG